MSVILPQRIALTDGRGFITNEWARAFDALTRQMTAAAPTVTWTAFIGDHGAGGRMGLVPAPKRGDAAKFLRGDGTWSEAGAGGGGRGTVTSVAATVPSFLSITGSPITEAGTLAIEYSGEALPAAIGGTGQTEYVAGDLLVASNTTELGRLAAGSAGKVLKSAGAGTAPAWGQVDLASDVKGDLPVENLAGGTDASDETYWRGDGKWAKPDGAGSSGGYIRGAGWSGGGAAIVAPANDVAITCAAAGTIKSATLLGAGTGSCVVDIWKTTFAAAPPTSADSICGASKPAIAAGAKAKDTTLTGWTTSVAAGDVLAFRLESCSGFTALSIILEIA